jgi:hypothetical protein
MNPGGTFCAGLGLPTGAEILQGQNIAYRGRNLTYRGRNLTYRGWNFTQERRPAVHNAIACNEACR